MPKNKKNIEAFRKAVYDYYEKSGRALPWRETTDPYHIYVSEIMLQQTQVSRVTDKFTAFIEAFPNVHALDSASLSAVLDVWQGLGYNRRALQMKKAARTIIETFDGRIPSSVDDLATLSGVGRATAAAICAYAFDMPVVYIETNIRTVFIHHFFPGRNDVSDSEILPLVEETLDTSSPRRWYSALMDYGVMLKSLHANPGRRSAHHTTQSRFEGSDRQIRGGILRALSGGKELTTAEIAGDLEAGEERVERILERLENEEFIKNVRGKYSINT